MRIDSTTRAIVTGASKGIGRAISTALAERGATLGLMARSRDGLEALADELPGEHVVLAGDVSRWAQTSKAVESFFEQAGGLDLVVANAGIAHYGRFIEQDAEQIEDMVRINVLGQLLTVKAALPHLLEGGRGHVVLLSSGAGLRAFPEAAVYGATKAANRGFGEALRHELAGTGVSLTTVYPGEFATELHAHERELLPSWRSNDEERDPAELAAAIVRAVEADRRGVFVPREVRLLGLNGILPGLVDFLLRRIRGESAAPRR